MFQCKGLVSSAIIIFALSISSTDGNFNQRLPLNDGNFIPVIGYHTGFDDSNLVEAERPNNIGDAVSYALAAGFRLIDTAQIYGNEYEVGKAVRASSVPRKDLYIVTKLSTYRKRDPVGALKESLSKLQMSYIDLYLIHHPVAFEPKSGSIDIVDYLDTWMGMEEAKKLGLAKSIGVANFNISQIQRLFRNCEIRPSVVQIEVNLNLAQTEFIKFCSSKNLVVMASSPLGGLFDTEAPPPRPYDPILAQIAHVYDKTAPQVILRYLIQRGVIPIPHSTIRDEIQEYIDISDFKLTPNEMKTLRIFNKNYRTVRLWNWRQHPYYPFETPLGPMGFENLKSVEKLPTSNHTSVRTQNRKGKYKSRHFYI